MREFFLADDLSGALDAAAAFHHAGRRVRIVLSAGDCLAADDAVTGVTTETRNAPPAIAADVVAATIARGQAQGARLVYKKIDSTLRGPVAAEIAALAQRLPGTRILLAPANPAVGRTVRDGVLLVHGVPVGETEFARDPVSPVREGNLHRLLGGAGGAAVVVADAGSAADLEAAVARMDAAGGAWVAVGSGALARPVAARGMRGARPAGATAGVSVTPGPILLLGGSAHAGNRTQAETLWRERRVPVHELRLAEPAAAVAAVSGSLRSGPGASLLVEAARGDSAAVLRTLTGAAAAIIAATGANRIFATGGETAFALCGALGIATLEFEAELEPGLSLSRARTARGDMRFAIKPGGFGTAGTWVRAWEEMQAGN
jgi:uncharacterized protein YgbK (DUF1537 family)